MPAAKAGGVQGVFRRKLGPAPVWVWAVSALVLWFLYRRFFAGGTAASQSSPTSIGTGTYDAGTVATGGGAPASGGGSAADNLNADLIGQLTGSLVGVNSNLTTALMNSTNAVEGLGSQALAQSGYLQQAIIQSYVPQQQVYVPTVQQPQAAAQPVSYGGQPDTRRAAIISSQFPSAGVNDVAAFRDVTGHVVNAAGSRVGGMPYQ